MKILNAVFAVCLLLFFYSCDVLDEDNSEDKQTEVDVTATYTEILNVWVPEVLGMPDESSRVQELGGFDLIDNPDVADVIGTPEQIKNVEVRGMTYEFRNFSGNVDTNLTNGTFTLTLSPLDTFSFEDVNIAEADLFGRVYTVSSDFNPVNEFIKKYMYMAYVLGGTATHNPASFQVVVNVTLKLRVEVDEE